MKARAPLLVAALALAAIGAEGCVSQPVVALDHAEIRSLQFPGGIGLTVFLRVNNKNAFDVQVRNVRGQATLGNRWILPPVDFSPNVWLPAGQTTVVAVPVVIPFDMLPGIVGQTLGASTIAYHFKGTADVTAVRMLGVQRNDYPVDDGGEVSRMALAQAAASVIPGLRIGY
jgi:hypothetical protein